jgi:hypothetical protein
MFNVSVFLVVYGFLQLLWVAGAFAAAEISMLTVGQMLASRPGSQGMPYLQHYGLWNDVVVVHPWCALMAGLFGVAWITEAPWTFGGVCLLSVAASAWANKAWVNGRELIAQGSHGELWAPGFIHIPQMSIILVVIFMTAIWILAGRIPWQLSVGSVCLMLAHLCIGWHWPLRYFQPSWSPFPYDAMTPVFALVYGVLTAMGLFFIFWHFLLAHA